MPFSRFAPATLLLAIFAAEAALTPKDAAVITEITQRAAYLEALTAYCGVKQPSGDAGLRSQLEAWKERNHWELFRKTLSGQPKFEPGFQQLRENFVQNLNAKPQNELLCTSAVKVMRSTEFDPSAQNPGNIDRIASVLSGGKAGQ